MTLNGSLSVIAALTRNPITKNDLGVHNPLATGWDVHGAKS